MRFSENFAVVFSAPLRQIPLFPNISATLPWVEPPVRRHLSRDKPKVSSLTADIAGFALAAIFAVTLEYTVLTFLISLVSAQDWNSPAASMF